MQVQLKPMLFEPWIEENKMNKHNSATDETADVAACHLTSSAQISWQVFGYVQPNRFYKKGKRVLVYRLPSDGKQFAVSKPLVFLLVLLLAAFVTGYVNGGHVPNKSGSGILPIAIVPANTFHRLITISAVRGVINLPINKFPKKLVQAEQPYRTDLLPRKYLSARENDLYTSSRLITKSEEV